MNDINSETARPASRSPEVDRAIEEARQVTRRFELVCDLFRYIVKAGAAVAAIFAIFWGLRPILLQDDASVISAIGQVIQTLHLGETLGYLATAIVGAAWFLERKGKKRAIEQKAHYQQIAESNEQDRSSSGLTQCGDTPNENPSQ